MKHELQKKVTTDNIVNVSSLLKKQHFFSQKKVAKRTIYDLSKFTKNENEMRGQEHSDVQAKDENPKDSDQEKQKQLFLKVFNKMCVMMQHQMVNEIIRMEMGKVYTVKTKKYIGSFLSIGAKNKVLPLFLAVKHSQLTSDSGI